MFSPSESRDYDESIRNCTRRNYSVPPISEDYLKLWVQMEPKFSSISMEDDGVYDILSDFHIEKENHPTEKSSLECVFLHGFDNAKSNNNDDAMQTRKMGHGKEDSEGGEECKRNKRSRSSEVHNLNERLRRRKLNEKMAILQEMIPNSIKRDQASTIDDAIKYIKNLQCLIQMMSAEAGQNLFRSPMVMSPHGHQGVKFPNGIPFPHTSACGNGMCMGMSVGYPAQLYPWQLRVSDSSSGLQSVDNNLGQFSGPIYANSVSCVGSQPSTGANPL